MKLPSLSEYYVQHVFPIARRFRLWSPLESSTVVCPIHEDNDPSMGFILTKEGEKFHCFGCGAAGTLVDLHRSVLRVHFGRRLSSEEARVDLYSLYGIAEDQIPEDTSWTRRLSRERDIDSARGQLGVGDLKAGIRRCTTRSQFDSLLTQFIIADKFTQHELLGPLLNESSDQDLLGVS